MIEKDKLIKVGGDILNCEGSLLALYTVDNELYLHSLLNDGSGKVFFKTKMHILVNFYNSKINIFELILHSEDVKVLIASPFNKSFLVNKNDLLGRIHCGSDYYKDFSSSTKQN